MPIKSTYEWHPAVSPDGFPCPPSIQLPKFLTTHPDVRVIVIDSVAFHFRHDWDDFAMRSRLLNSMAQRLANIAVSHQAAGRICTNFFLF